MGWIMHIVSTLVKVLGCLTNHKIPTCHSLVKATFRVEDQDHNMKDSNLKNIDSSCNCLKD